MGPMACVVDVLEGKMGYLGSLRGNEVCGGRTREREGKTKGQRKEK